MTNCILKCISKYFVKKAFKIGLHCKILKMYLNYYLKYMYFKILPSLAAYTSPVVQEVRDTTVDRTVNNVSSIHCGRHVAGL